MSIQKMKNKSRNISLIACSIIFLFAALYAGTVIVDFRGEPGPNRVTLSWSTLSELNCKDFQIERSLNKTDFKKIGIIDGAGASSSRKNYEYIDYTVFKPQTDRTFYYRLKVITIDDSESTYSEIISVTPSISGARYTWGSIKALFR